MRLIICALVFGCILQAEDAGLRALRDVLVPMRTKKSDDIESRGPTQQLTVAKHLLREWLESKLSDYKHSDDPKTFAQNLNRLLEDAGLQCGKSIKCPGENELWNPLGFLKDVQLSWRGPFLIVQTGVGILCGNDESAYAYERTEAGWKRRWQSEQNVYVKGKYSPQTIESVEITRYSEKKSYLILTLGSESWCSSNWHDVYYRLWQVKMDSQESHLLLDKSEWVFMAEQIRGTVSENDALIEYHGRSIDTGILVREKVQHFVVSNDAAQRVDPIALSPRDFVDEWLTQPWSEMNKWSAMPSLEAEHQTLSKAPSGFTEPTMHCQTPDLWQVRIDFGAPAEESQPHYFLVRWKPPYRFTMAAINDHPWPKCTEKDPEADATRTLFAGGN